jgi:hypothetical protein
MLVDPSELLTEHHALLHTDFEPLGSGTAVERLQYGSNRWKGQLLRKEKFWQGRAKEGLARGTGDGGIPDEQRSNLSTTDKKGALSHNLAYWMKVIVVEPHCSIKSCWKRFPPSPTPGSCADHSAKNDLVYALTLFL